MAEERNVSLQDAITAVAVGYEVMIRLGFVDGDRFLERGYQTRSLIGSFGAAAAIGRLVGTKPQQIVDAFGICGAFASGICWPTHSRIEIALIRSPSLVGRTKNQL